jgi:hypothetical protein
MKAIQLLTSIWALFPSVPALVLSGDLDSIQVPSADAREVAALFPRSKFVELADSGHHTVFSWRGECSRALVQRFLHHAPRWQHSVRSQHRLRLPRGRALPTACRRSPIGDGGIARFRSLDNG